MRPAVHNCTHVRCTGRSVTRPGRLVGRISGLNQVPARPPARFGARRKRSEIGRSNAAEGLAAIWTAVRDNVVARGDRSFRVAISGLKELDRGIQVIAADGACAPDSHVRRQLLFRLIRYLVARWAPSHSKKSRRQPLLRDRVPPASELDNSNSTRFLHVRMSRFAQDEPL